MPKNQLFRQPPPLELCERVLHAFGLSSFEDRTLFSRQDLETLQCVASMAQLKHELMQYYLPCKGRTYLNDLTTKNVITILRQLARLFGHTMRSQEKYVKGRKFIIYQLTDIERQTYQPVTITSARDIGVDSRTCTVRFD